MNGNAITVSEGTRAFVNFSLSLADGSEIDSNFPHPPSALNPVSQQLLSRPL